MLNVAPKPAHTPLRSAREHALEIQRRQQANSITLRGINPRDVLSFHFVTLSFVVFFLVKVSLVSYLGAEGYAERVEMFLDGTVVEQIAGRLLTVDPITAAVSQMFGVYQ